jgi:hypothetical protein
VGLARCGGETFELRSGSTLDDVVFSEGRGPGIMSGNAAVKVSGGTLSNLSIVRYHQGVVVEIPITLGGTAYLAGFLEPDSAVLAKSADLTLSVVAQEVAGGVVAASGGRTSRVLIAQADLRWTRERGAVAAVTGSAGLVRIGSASISVVTGHIAGVVAIREGGTAGEVEVVSVSGPVPALVMDDGAGSVLRAVVRGSSLASQAVVRLDGDHDHWVNIIDQDTAYPQLISTFSGQAAGRLARGSQVGHRDGVRTFSGEHKKASSPVHGGSASLEVAAFAGERYRLDILALPATAGNPVKVEWWVTGNGNAAFSLGTATVAVTAQATWQRQELTVTPSSDGVVVLAVEVEGGATESRIWIDDVVRL